MVIVVNPHFTTLYRVADVQCDNVSQTQALRISRHSSRFVEFTISSALSELRVKYDLSLLHGMLIDCAEPLLLRKYFNEGLIIFLVGNSVKIV